MNTKNSTYRRKNSLRLKGFDYSSEGVYFITMLTKDRIKHFGMVNQAKVKLSNIGEIIKDEWLHTEDLRENVVLGFWVIMPDHFHALLAIKGNSVSSHCNATVLDNGFKNSFGPQSNNLSSIVRGFKASYTRRIRKEVNPSFAWHRSFHDRVVRDQNELERIEEYIINNPLKFSIKNNSTIN